VRIGPLGAKPRCIVFPGLFGSDLVFLLVAYLLDTGVLTLRPTKSTVVLVGFNTF
jgi:hypothetical protein